MTQMAPRRLPFRPAASRPPYFLPRDHGEPARSVPHVRTGKSGTSLTLFCSVSCDNRIAKLSAKGFVGTERSE
jgi:hypothetical protein